MLPCFLPFSMPNLRDVFEDQESVYLVMELCEGGELFDSIASRGHYSEKVSGRVVRQNS